jgi:hypothetical protein
MAQSEEKDYTINKSILLNWLNVSDEKLPIKELGAWIEARTKGEYKLIRQKNINNNQKQGY